MPAIKDSSESCSALQAYSARAFRSGGLTGEDSLEASVGLEGAENIGHEGERGEVGLGEAGLVDMLLPTFGF